jgi:hypothetical protein
VTGGRRCRRGNEDGWQGRATPHGFPPAPRSTGGTRSAGPPHVLRVSIEPGEAQAWFWANVCSGLKCASVAPPHVIRSLENETARTFPLALADAARHLTQPVVIVVGNVDQITSGQVRDGLDVLACHAPPSLRVQLAG